MIKDYNTDINRWIISQCNPQEKSAAELSVVSREPGQVACAAKPQECPMADIHQT